MIAVLPEAFLGHGWTSSLPFPQTMKSMLGEAIRGDEALKDISSPSAISTLVMN